MPRTIDGFRVNDGGLETGFSSADSQPLLSGNGPGLTVQPACFSNWIKLVVLVFVLIIVFFAGAEGGIAYAKNTIQSSPPSSSPTMSSTPSVSPTPSLSPFLSHNWHSVASSADGNVLIAVESPGCIWTSFDAGVTWKNYAKSFALNFQSVASSADGTFFVVVVNQYDFGGPIYTTPSKNSYYWQSRGNVNRWASVASSSDGGKLVALADQIYTSVNFGVTWTPRGSNSTQNWVAAASSSDGSKLVAAANDHIYTSIDFGVSWSQSPNKYGDWKAVACSSDGSTIIAVTGQYGSIFTSADSGATWTQRSDNVGVRDFISVASSANGTTLVAVSRQGTSSGSMFVSVDSGLTWTFRCPTIYCPDQRYLDFSAVAISADGSKIIATVNGDKIYLSGDSGVTWRPAI